MTVNCVPWDHHGTAPQLKTEEGAKKLIPPLDRAIAALIDDLIDRGLYDSTLVVAMGEFGRTPRMNKDAGRDHWGNTFSVLMGCGSMRMGQVIGRSNARGEHVVDRPISPQDVAATVYHHLGIDARARHLRRPGRAAHLPDRRRRADPRAGRLDGPRGSGWDRGLWVWPARARPALASEAVRADDPPCDRPRGGSCHGPGPH